LLILAIASIGAVMFVQRKREMNETLAESMHGAPITLNSMKSQDFTNYASANQLSIKRRAGDTAEYMTADGIYGREGAGDDDDDEDDPYANNAEGGKRRGGGDQVYGLSKGPDDEDVYGLANHDGDGKKVGGKGGQQGPATYDVGEDGEAVYGLKRSSEDQVYSNNAGVNETRRRSNESSGEGAYSNNKDLKSSAGSSTLTDRRSTRWEAPDNSAGVYGLEAEDPDGPVYGLANNVGGPGGSSVRGGGGGGGGGAGDDGEVYNNRGTVDPVYGLGVHEPRGSSVRSTGSKPDNAMVYTVASASGKVAETSLDDMLPPPLQGDGGGEGVYENRSTLKRLSTRVVKGDDPVYGLGARGSQGSARSSNGDAADDAAGAAFVASAGASTRSKGGRPSVQSETLQDDSGGELDDEDPDTSTLTSSMDIQFDTMERQAFASLLRAEGSRDGSRVASLVATDDNEALPDGPPDSDEEEDKEVSSSVVAADPQGIGGKGLRPIMPLPQDGNLQFKRGSVHRRRGDDAGAGADAGGAASALSPEVRAAIFAAAEATEAAAAALGDDGEGEGGSRRQSFLDFSEQDQMEGAGGDGDGDGPPPGWNPSKRRSSLGMSGRAGRRRSLTAL